MEQEVPENVGVQDGEDFDYGSIDKVGRSEEAWEGFLSSNSSHNISLPLPPLPRAAPELRDRSGGDPEAQGRRLSHHPVRRPRPSQGNDEWQELRGREEACLCLCLCVQTCPTPVSGPPSTPQKLLALKGFSDTKVEKVRTVSQRRPSRSQVHSHTASPPCAFSSSSSYHPADDCGEEPCDRGVTLHDGL